MHAFAIQMVSVVQLQEKTTQFVILTKNKKKITTKKEKTTNPGKSRPKDITLGSSGKVIKKPKLLGPKINAKFGDQAPKYSEDEMDKARRLGETARKRVGDNLLAKGDTHPASVKKPRITGARSSSSSDGLVKTTLQDQSGVGKEDVHFLNHDIKSKCKMMVTHLAMVFQTMAPVALVSCRA